MAFQLSHPPIEVVIVGAGPIGAGAAAAVARRPGLTLVAVVDTDPQKVGTELAGMTVRRELPPPSDEARVAVLTTSSSLARLEPLVLECLARGMAVVSTCEELAWPWSNPAVARRIDDAARNAGRGVLGTGVNPGFVMDALPLSLTAPCLRVDAVRVERVQDASTRRRPFQDKIGVGQDPAAVGEALAARRIGHVGLAESAAMVSARLGVATEAFVEERRVVVAEHVVERAGRRVEVGQALGVEQIGRATRGDHVVVELLFRATFGAERSWDRVLIEGEPRLDVRIEGGIPGDVATCAIVANAVPVVARAPGGLHTMADLPLVVASG
ncbi:MAG: dihydrodipicolinate reductase [Deltaproteobacteria bacterium]|nr:dihydrodipicolinate reductase [Deltaproteobacteria bacterium]